MVDRNTVPQFFESSKINLPEPDIVTLSNGSRLFCIKIGDQPVVKIEFIFRAGNWFEAAPGIAFLTGKMLLEGTKSYSSNQIAQRFESYGAFVEISSGLDYVNLSLHLPIRHFYKVFDLVEEILFNPVFPEKELELLREIQIQQLRVNQLKNNFVGGRLFRSKLFENEPYGHVITEEIHNQITVEDLRNHFRKWMAGRFECIVTGNFSNDLPDKICSQFNDYLKEMIEFTPTRTKRTGYFAECLEKEGSLQSSIFMGKRCINKSDENYPGLLLLNEVFGGYFGSRLMQNIREEKGYTYSIYSHLVTLKNHAYFIINSEVKKENKDQAIEEIQKEINLIKNEIIGKDELRKVKNYLKGSIINSLTSPFAISEKLKSIYFYDLDLGYYDQLFDQIDSMDELNLYNIANTLLFDEQLSSVIIG